MTPSASPHAATTVHVRSRPHQRPLVKPGVRFSRLRLSDDRSAIGIHNELRIMTKQVSTTLAQLLGLTAQFPSPKRGFQDQRDPFFRRGHYVQAVLPPLMKTRAKSCPLAPRGLAASSLLWAGPAPGQDRKERGRIEFAGAAACIPSRF